MWQGQMRGKRKTRALFIYPISRNHSETRASDKTGVARSCVSWLFFFFLVGSVRSPCCTIYLLHCLLGISLSICLSVCLLALAFFSPLPPLKRGFLGCCDSHVIPACCTKQTAAPVQRAPQLRYSLAPIQTGLTTLTGQWWTLLFTHIHAEM